MPEQSNNYFVKLYRGDVPLVITFWVFYILFGLVVAPLFPDFIRILLFIYLSLALWNSATHYKGFEFWRDLAKIIVALLALVQAYDVMMLSLGIDVLDKS